jgi:hypothetical protein
VSKKSDDKSEENVEAKQEPMRDTELFLVDCCVALCIDAVDENYWDCSSPLITVSKIFKLSGEGSCIATKIDQHNDFENCLWTNRVMEFGKHRISLKLMKAGMCVAPVDHPYEHPGGLTRLFGLVRDGATWNKDYGDTESTDAWYMASSNGCLYGNGKEGDDDDDTGSIKEGQIVSMEVDLDKGMLRFWVDGKQHGPGFIGGVTGRLRWAVSVYDKGGAAQIVPTPELQPWSASWVLPESDEE